MSEVSADLTQKSEAKPEVKPPLEKKRRDAIGTVVSVSPIGSSEADDISKAVVEPVSLSRKNRDAIGRVVSVDARTFLTSL